MAADFSLLLLEEDAGNGNAMIKRSGQTVKMRKYGTLTDYDLTEVGSSAKYKRTSLPTGLYQVVVNGSVDSSYGIIPWFDGELAGEAITSGTISTSRLPTGIDAANIADGSISNTEFQRLNGISSNIEDRFDGIDSTLSDKASLTGTNNPNGQWEFSGYYPLVDNAIEAPTDPRHVTTKDYVDGQLAAYAVAPYQEAGNRVRVITNGTLETGKVYRGVNAASSYLGTPSATNPGFIDLVKPGADGIFHINGSTTIKNYLTIAGKGLYTKVCLSDTNASLTKSVEFQNMTLFFGANDIPGARSYNSFTFRDCVIYAYENTTFTNCKFYNTVIIHASSKSATLSSCICWNAHFNQYVAADTPTLGFMTHGFDTGLSYYAIPTDPSLEP